MDFFTEPAMGWVWTIIVNPKTGEILGADIMLEWTYITNRIVADELFNESEDNPHCAMQLDFIN